MANFGKKVLSKGNKHSTPSSAYSNPKPAHNKTAHAGAVTGKDSAKIIYHGKKSGICEY